MAASEREEEWGLVVSDATGKFASEKCFTARQKEWAAVGPIGLAGWAGYFALFFSV